MANETIDILKGLKYPHDESHDNLGIMLDVRVTTLAHVLNAIKVVVDAMPSHPKELDLQAQRALIECFEGAVKLGEIAKKLM